MKMTQVEMMSAPSTGSELSTCRGSVKAVVNQKLFCVTFPVLVCKSFTNLVIIEDSKLQAEDSFERIWECSVRVQLPSKNEIALLKRNECFDFLKTVTVQMEADEEAIQWLPHRF